MLLAFSRTLIFEEAKVKYSQDVLEKKTLNKINNKMRSLVSGRLTSVHSSILEA